MDSFLEQALVFFASAVILVPIFQRLKCGSVLGYLIAGVIVGPFGLKLIHDSKSVVQFSELGVVLLLFLIGLEIQPRKLWSMRRHLIGLGGLQIFLSSIVFALAALALGLSPVASSLVGISLSLSSTAFALQTLTERNQFNTEFGRASFSILLMQDLVAIPVLALVPMLGDGDKHPHFSAQGALVSFSIILALLLGSRYLLRPIFRIIAGTRAREIFTATTLLIVLGVAALMQKIGLSAALGTFVAGVLLADSEYRHEIETNLEPFKSLLMGLFFIAIGMEVSLDIIGQHPILILALTLAYLSLKTAVIYASGRIFKLGHENSKMMAMTISQGGEFAFVIFGMILQFQLGNPELLALSTVVVSLSMAFSPLIILANEKIAEHYECKQTSPQYDVISGESPEVIIGGYGRWGQIFGRILKAQDIPYVAIDHDAAQIELVRRFGIKVYYGDVARRDLLEAAGAARAKYFILGIDDVEMSLQTAKLILEEFPHLKIFARARNRGHAFDLMALGIKTIKRETFDSSVSSVKDLLVHMGVAPKRANEIAERFTIHDEKMLEEQFKVRSDTKRFVSVAQQANAQLAQVLNEDDTKSYVELGTQENSSSR